MAESMAPPRSPVLALCCFLAAACGGSTAGGPPGKGDKDGGAGGDGGTAALSDGGTPDEGSSGAVDSGSPGVAPDSGSLGAAPDSGNAGGPAGDAGPRGDAGAGGVDAGQAADAGPAADAGTPGFPASLPPYVYPPVAIATLDFGVNGDTRPILYDLDYPTAVITTIFEDLAALQPPVAFVVATGDYMFADPTGLLGNKAAEQANLWMGAAQKFLDIGSPVYASMGNHECDWATSNDNCYGQETTNENYEAFLENILGGLGISQGAIPYYAVTYESSDPTRPWTAKFLYTAPNSWDSNDVQKDWVDQVLSIPTTYTFLVRHEPTNNPGPAPGVQPTDDLLTQHPFTLKLTGHSHCYQYDLQNREVINGLAGAQIDTGCSYDYGYVVCRQRDDMAIQCSLYDYQSNAVVSGTGATFAVTPAGADVPPQ